MPVIRNGSNRTTVIRDGRIVTAAIVNGIDRLEDVGDGSEFMFATANVSFSISPQGVVSLEAQRGTIVSATYGNNLMLDPVTTRVFRENEVTVEVPATGYTNPGARVTGTVTTFQPAANPPDVVTLDPLFSGGNNATMRGRINNDGGFGVTASGFYLVAGDADVTRLRTVGTLYPDGTTNGLFFEDTGVLPFETLHSYVAFATNQIGTDYGVVRQFTTGERALLLGDILITLGISGAGTVTAVTNGRGVITGMGATMDNILPVTTDGNTFTASLYPRSDRRIGRDIWITYRITDPNAANFNSALGPVRQTATQEPTLVNVTTSSAINVTATRATLRGAINDLVGAGATTAGFYWGTSPNNIEDQNRVVSTDITGIVEETITGLTQGTEYYFAIFGGNEFGETVGSVVDFETNPVTINRPQVMTEPVTNLRPTTVTLHGEVLDDGGAAVSTGRFFYSTDADFGLFNFRNGTYPNAIAVTPVERDGDWSVDIAGLTPNTRYFYSFAATNGAGWDIGETIEFDTPLQLSVRIDGPEFVELFDDVVYTAVVTTSSTDPITYNWTEFDPDPNTQDGEMTTGSLLTQTLEVLADGLGSRALRVSVTQNSQTVTDDMTIFIVRTTLRPEE